MSNQTDSTTFPSTPVQIEITRKDIEYAQRNDPQNCMLALAINRTVQDLPDLDVFSNIDNQYYVQYCFGGGREMQYKRFDLDAKTNQKISAWDNGATIEPFTVIVDFDNRALEWIGYSKVNAHV